MRKGFAHAAVLTMDADADTGAPGAAITVALCGHWEHEPPCPLAPHFTHAMRVADEVHLRILFAVDARRKPLVRRSIDAALAAGRLVAADGVPVRWQLRSSNPADVGPDEAEHAEHLVAS